MADNAKQGRSSLQVSHPRPVSRSRAISEDSCLFEMLQQLAFETALRIGESSLRVGLAATTWQLKQAQTLLECAGLQTHGARPHAGSEIDNGRIVAVALDTALGCNPRALATISLHRDGSAGLTLDQRYGTALASLRAEGARLVEVEQLAFDQRIPIPLLIKPMIRALGSIVLGRWDSTDVVLACARRDAPFYCENLGFARLAPARRKSPGEEVLLHLPTSRLGHLLAPTLGSARLPE